MEEAEAAAQGYVAGTMEADGFAYDGAAVYDVDTNMCLRVYGDYPDEKAQTQAAIYTVEHDRDADLPPFLDEHLIEAILLDDGGRKHTRQEIFAYFQANRDITTRTEFLKNSYNDMARAETRCVSALAAFALPVGFPRTVMEDVRPREKRDRQLCLSLFSPSKNVTRHRSSKNDNTIQKPSR